MGLIGSNEYGVTGLALQTVKYTKGVTGTVIPAVTGKSIYVYAVKQVVDAAISTKWRSGSVANDLEELQAIAANGGYIEAVAPPAYLFKTNIGESLDLVISGTGNAAGRVSYWTA